MPSHTLNQLPDLIRVDRTVLVLGRGADADVRLPHPGVSRRHAELRLDGGTIHVRDRRSRGGVFVNGVAVRTATLGEDDVVSFGPISYEVKGGHLRLVLSAQGVTVEARALTIRRGPHTVLSSVNVSIPSNNFVGILGPSGAGKTTLLKGLTGYLPAASGQVFFDGLEVATHAETCRSMTGFVPQEDVVFGTLTARENLDFALRLRVVGDLRAAEREAWVAHTLKRLSLEEHADRPVEKLSGGQKKRVSVAVELLSRPRLLFLDEPTAGLDPAAEARLMHFFRDLAHRGTTVICTTHVMESLDLFDVVIVVAGGRVLGSGNPKNLLNHFKAQTFAELYETLENPPAPPARTDLPPPELPMTISVRTTHRRTGTLSQTVTQFFRGLRLISRDRMLLALFVGQPLLIGFLITLSQVRPGDVKQLDLFCTFAVVTCIWLGLNNTARELVRDRAIYVRERRATVNPESYLLAKVVLFACLGLAQVVLLALWLRYLNFIPRDCDAHKALLALSMSRFIVVLWVTYLSAMLLGLLISALSPTQEVAVAALPVVVLPQLLLSGPGSERQWAGLGYFNSLPILLDKAGAETRGIAGWMLEVASLFTYSRPALVFFLNFDEKPTMGVVDWSHLLLLLLVTATAFVAIFLKRERRWLEEA